MANSSFHRENDLVYDGFQSIIAVARPPDAFGNPGAAIGAER
jgi:hypothetical protein